MTLPALVSRRMSSIQEFSQRIRTSVAVSAAASLQLLMATEHPTATVTERMLPELLQERITEWRSRRRSLLCVCSIAQDQERGRESLLVSTGLLQIMLSVFPQSRT
jgi:hypothetical protein